jgi:hypothetical protein
MFEEMMLLVSRFAEYLRRSERQLQCFHEYELQVEGWFKGELLCFLDQEKPAGHLLDFELERLVHVGDGRRGMRVDVVLQFDNKSLSWVELKHWHIGTQNRTYYGCDWYFRNGVEPEVEKLLTIPEDGDKFMLVLLTKNPGPEEWDAGVRDFNTRFSPLSVCSLTNPSDYPDFFFLGLLRVCPKEASIDVPREGA